MISIFFEKSEEEILDEMDKEISDPNTKFFTHEEVFSKLRRKLNEQ